MKRINLIFVIALVFSAAFIFSAGAGDAFIPSEEFEALETTEIKLVNEAGDSPVTLNSGEKLTASVKVRNNSEEGIELVLYCVLSENNRVKEIYSYPDTAKANDITPFTKEFTLPEETEGLTLNVMLWDSEENIKNACTALRIPDEGAAVRIIDFEGNVLEGFEEEKTQYEIKIPASLRKPALLNAFPVDGGTKIIVQPPVFFPGKTVINAIARDGTVKEYAVNYLCDDILASDAAVHEKLNARYTPVVKKNLAVNDDCFSDKASGTYSTFTYLDEEIAGKEWICCPANWAVLSSQKKFWNGSENGSMKMFSFNLSKTAVIRVLCESECSVAGSFSDADGWIKKEVTEPYYKRVYEEEEISSVISYEKTVTVPEGETLNVEIPNHGGEAAYIIVIDYLYDSF